MGKYPLSTDDKDVVFDGLSNRILDGIRDCFTHDNNKEGEDDPSYL